MTGLPREISLTLLFKLAALFLLWLLFFRDDLRPHPDAGTIASDLLSSTHTQPSEQRGSTNGP